MSFNLPNDIIYEIIKHLPLKDLNNCSSINHQFNSVYKNDYLWKCKCENDIGKMDKLFNGNYYECYKRWYGLNKLIKVLKLSKTVGELLDCVELNLYNIRIVELPKEIGNLTNLKSIHCDSNQLTRLPIELLNLHNLTYIYYSHNPIDYIPPNLQRFLEIGRAHV